MKPLNYTQLATRYDRENSAVWAFMDPRPRACFTPLLLDDLRNLQGYVELSYQEENFPVRYLVLASRKHGIFNLGGDLHLFLHHIESRDRAGLLKYAESCINLLSFNMNSTSSHVTSIALVQGRAFGGGFEAALSCNTIIAERSAQMGLPEIMFNMFPGMGAYSFLSRRLSPAAAERIILEGKIHTAEELYGMGLVDVLAEDGEGKAAVDRYIAEHQKKRNARLALQKVKNRVHTVSHAELLDVTRIWVDTAMNLEKRDLAVMNRVVRSQDSVELKLLMQEAELIRKRSNYEWRQAAADPFPLLDFHGQKILADRRKRGRRR